MNVLIFKLSIYLDPPRTCWTTIKFQLDLTNFTEFHAGWNPTNFKRDEKELLKRKWWYRSDTLLEKW